MNLAPTLSSFSPIPIQAGGESWLTVGLEQVPLVFARHRRARRYVLRLTSQGAARVTIPQGGSVAEGRRFAESQQGWLARQLQLRRESRPRSRAWFVGDCVLWHGEPVQMAAVTLGGASVVGLGDHRVPVVDLSGDLRPELERYLWSLAKDELPPRVSALARQHGLAVRAVTVRNQKSRWGSCSRRGTISLNWRLIQTPDFVRDSIILHELAHLREMNHSPRFWRTLMELCPGYQDAERWLRAHTDILR